jgi:hypothetical protein
LVRKHAAPTFDERAGHEACRDEQASLIVHSIRDDAFYDH